MGLRALGISLACENGSSIQEQYERGEYEKIVHHNVEDVLITERLYYHLMNCDFDPFSARLSSVEGVLCGWDRLFLVRVFRACSRAQISSILG